MIQAHLDSCWLLLRCKPCCWVPLLFWEKNSYFCDLSLPTDCVCWFDVLLNVHDKTRYTDSVLSCTSPIQPFFFFRMISSLMQHCLQFLYIKTKLQKSNCECSMGKNTQSFSILSDAKKISVHPPVYSGQYVKHALILWTMSMDLSLVISYLFSIYCLLLR